MTYAERARAIADRVREYRGTGTEEILIRCLFHDDRTPSLSVSLAKGIYHCFGCGARGKWRLPAVARPGRLAPAALARLPTNAQPIRGGGPPEAYRYLRGRGLSDPEIDGREWYYVSRGEYAYGDERALPVRRRIVIPVGGSAGRWAFWTARDVTGLQERKYVNMPGASKADWLYNGHRAAGFPDWVLVEGPFDARAAHFVSLLGKSLSAEQKRQIVAAGPERVTVMLDEDAQEDAWTVARQLSPFIRTVRVACPVGDPGSMGVRELTQILETAEPFSRAAWAERAIRGGF